MIHFIFGFVTELVSWSQTVWIFCYFFKRPPLSSEVAKVYVAIMRWPCLVGWPLPIWFNLQEVIYPGHWWSPIVGVLGALIDVYWAYIMWKTRHDDDDFWKKVKRKVKSAVKVISGKLVVVPIPSPVPS